MSVQTKVTDYFSSTKKAKGDKYDKSKLVKVTTPKSSSTPFSSPSLSSRLLNAPKKSSLKSRSNILKQEPKRKLNPTNLLSSFESQAKRLKESNDEPIPSTPSTPVKALESPMKSKTRTFEHLAFTPKKSVFEVNKELGDSPKIQSGHLKGISFAFYEKIKAKEAIKELSNLANKKDYKKIEMLGRLDELIRIIHSYFIGQNKIAIPYDDVVSKCRVSYHICLSIKDVQEHIDYLLDLFPKWIETIPKDIDKFNNKSNVHIKIDKTVTIKDLINKLNSEKCAHEKLINN